MTKGPNFCPRWESIHQIDNDINFIKNSRPYSTRCEQCIHWNNGSCELFLAKGQYD